MSEILQYIAEKEQERLKELGYSSIVEPVTIAITKRVQILHIGNDSYIFHKISIEDNDLFNTNETIGILSGNECVDTLRISDFVRLSSNTPKILKNHIIVKTYDMNSFLVNTTINPYTLHFLKITPFK